MSKRNYLVIDKINGEVICVVSNIDADNISEGNIDLIDKVGLAIEEHFCYEERVKIVHGSIHIVNGLINMEFRALDEIEEEEIREIVLEQIAVY